MYKDYYKILGIEKHVSVAEIKKAYRQLAMKYHPDRNKSSDAHLLFLEISEAYEILSHTDKRRVYDNLTANTDTIEFKGEKVEFEEMINESRRKAQSYAQMAFNDFLNRAGFVIATGVRATINLSTLLFSGVFFFGGLYGIVTYIQDVIAGNIETFYQILVRPIIILALTGVGLLSLIQMFKETAGKDG